MGDEKLIIIISVAVRVNHQVASMYTNRNACFLGLTQTASWLICSAVFTFLVPAYPGYPGKEAVKWL